MIHHVDPLCQCQSCSYTTLNAILDELIPACHDNTIPGLVDLNASKTLLTSQKSELILKQLLDLNQLVKNEYQMSFGMLTKSSRQEFIKENAAQWKRITDFLGPIALMLYFENPEVLDALGIDSRPPFPRGHAVEQGNWDLLEPVYLRGQIYKEVT